VTARALASIAAALVLAIAATALAEAGVGARAPEIGLADRSGRRVTMVGLRGRVVLVDFWGAWCRPCEASMPVYERLHSTYGPRGLTIVGVGQDRTAAGFQRFLSRHRVSFTMVHDRARAVAGRYVPNGLPTSFVVDRNGIIRHVHHGWHARDAGTLESEIRTLLAVH
jgi:peroxiredoxin